MGGVATRYSNGFIPRSALISIASGVNGDGPWEHLLSPSQRAKHFALVARARKRHGRTLKITSGWNAYRPYAAQVIAKRKYGPDAAAPKFSSHGGTYNGRDAMAMDYGNWSYVYDGDKAAFYADCRAVDLTPGVIAREPWHVIDLDPWAAVPSEVVIPDAAPAPEPEEEDEDMPIIIRNTDNKEVSLLDPDVGRDLPRLGFGEGKPEHRSEKTAKGVVNTYRGFIVTTDPDVAASWGRSYCRLYDSAPQDRQPADYQSAQREASRIAFEKHG